MKTAKMKALPYRIAPVLLVCILSSFCLKAQIIPGAYQEKSDNTDLSEKEELILYPDLNHSFEYWLYSDEGDIEKYGSGTYNQSSKKLVLRFKQSNAPLSFLEKVSEDPESAKVVYQFHLVESKSGNSIDNTQVQILDRYEKQIATTETNADGEARIEITGSTEPVYVKIDSPTFQDLFTTLDPHSCEYTAYLALNHETLVENGSVMKFRILNVDKTKIALERNDIEKRFTLKSTDY